MDTTNTTDVVLPFESGFGYRARFDLQDPATGEGNTYFAGTQNLLQMKWLPSPGTLTLTAYWKSDFTQAIQACRVYDMPNLSGTPHGILTVKDTEAFAFVKEN